MTVEEALRYCLTEHSQGMLTDVLIIGYDKDGCLTITNSDMTRGEANWMLDKAKMETLKHVSQ